MFAYVCSVSLSARVWVGVVTVGRANVLVRRVCVTARRPRYTIRGHIARGQELRLRHRFLLSSSFRYIASSEAMSYLGSGLGEGEAVPT